MRRRDFWRRIFSVEVDPDERHPLVPARLRMHPPHIPRKLLDCFALLVENLNPPVFVCRRTVVSGDAAPSFVFQNDCRGSERGFTSSAATSRVSTASSRGRGSQSPPRHGKRLVMLTAVAVSIVHIVPILTGCLEAASPASPLALQKLERTF